VVACMLLLPDLTHASEALFLEKAVRTASVRVTRADKATQPATTRFRPSTSNKRHRRVTVATHLDAPRNYVWCSERRRHRFRSDTCGRKAYHANISYSNHVTAWLMAFIATSWTKRLLVGRFHVVSFKLATFSLPLRILFCKVVMTLFVIVGVRPRVY